MEEGIFFMADIYECGIETLNELLYTSEINISDLKALVFLFTV